MLSDWLKFIILLATSNQSAQFQSRVITLLWNFFMRLARYQKHFSFQTDPTKEAIQFCFPPSGTDFQQTRFESFILRVCPKVIQCCKTSVRGSTKSLF